MDRPVPLHRMAALVVWIQYISYAPVVARYNKCIEIQACLADSDVAYRAGIFHVGPSVRRGVSACRLDTVVAAAPVRQCFIIDQCSPHIRESDGPLMHHV